MKTTHIAYLRFAFGAALLFGTARANAEEITPPQQTCAKELVTLGDQWDAIGLPSPGKPAQGRVYGAAGHTHTGGEVDFMRQQLGKAARSCKAGEEHEAMLRMDAVRAIMKFAEIAHPASHHYVVPRS